MARDFSFVHTGDLHLDSPFRGLSSAAPDRVSSVLREATAAAWDAIVRLALEERVDFFLVAGDAFESANRTLPGQVKFRDGLRRLAGAGIPSFVVTGNHDHEAGLSASVGWPELTHRFPTDRVASAPVVRAGEEIARVYGIGYPVRDVRSNLAARFRKEPDAPYAVGLLHANVGGDPSTDNYAPCTLEDLRASGMDYWALGHVHRHRILLTANPVAVYCGNPQGRDPNEEEARGCYLVRVAGGRTTPEFRAVDVVRWRRIAVPIDGLERADDLVERVIAAATDARDEAGRSIVARVTLTGRGPLHTEIAKRRILLDDVAALANEAIGDLPPFSWIESLRDETRPARDLAALEASDEFIGDVLRRFTAARLALEADPGGADAATLGLAEALDETLDPLWSHQLARPLHGERPDRARLAELLERARVLVADRLAEEG